ncbi:hypothetical protein U1Q18_001225, partial [Sarracenia purpurea var. burkii]
RERGVGDGGLPAVHGRFLVTRLIHISGFCTVAMAKKVEHGVDSGERVMFHGWKKALVAQ